MNKEIFVRDIYKKRIHYEFDVFNRMKNVGNQLIINVEQ
jgi:hypothetical protein